MRQPMHRSSVATATLSRPQQQARVLRQMKMLGGLALAGGLLWSVCSGLARAEGLTLPGTEASNITSAQPHTLTAAALLRSGTVPAPLRPFGDYFFFGNETDANGMPVPATSGLRASTGLIASQRSFSLFDSPRDGPAGLAYLGLGYSRLWLRSQLALDADFGLASQGGGTASHLRGMVNGSQTLDDVVRDLRWAPVMSVKLAWAF